MSSVSASSKPIILYDYLPGILAGYPAVLFALLALLSVPQEFVDKGDGSVSSATAIDSTVQPGAVADVDSNPTEFEYPWWVPNPHMLFWIGLSIMIVWYIAFRFNLPKSKFWLLFGLVGTFVGIPVVLEIFDVFKVFSLMAGALGYFAPQANAGAYFVIALVFFVIWLGNFIYSRTHMRVVIDESGLTINRLGGKGERFELIGLKTENEPLDYIELFLAGIGSLALKTRMDREIFRMDRVIGLYRLWFFPFYPGKLQRIEQVLSYQGKVVSVEAQEAADAADQMDMESDEGAAAGGEESDAEGGVGESEHRDIK